MPHKHRRKGEDDSIYDLPPTQRAAPLPVGKVPSSSSNTNKNLKRKRPSKEPACSTYGFDDTPAAFKRLQRLVTNRPKPRALDDGPAPKHRKSTSTSNTPTTATAVPKILPGERLSDFSARVDAALPIAHLGKAARVGAAPGRQTRLERKMQRKYAEWRKEDVAIREREARAREAVEEAEMEEDDDGGAARGEWRDILEGSRRRKKKVEDDPWAELKKKRGKRIKIGEVNQEPLKFEGNIRQVLKVPGDGVPGRGGGLKRREELGEARKEVIERYRAMMAAKRGSEA